MLADELRSCLPVCVSYIIISLAFTIFLKDKFFLAFKNLFQCILTVDPIGFTRSPVVYCFVCVLVRGGGGGK